MSVETDELTLPELLGPDLKAVFIGINPSITSARIGHYYQGAHGQRFWKLLQEYGLAHDLRPGRQDLDAHAQGYGFTDLIRIATRCASDLTKEQLDAAVPDLAARLRTQAPNCKIAIFRYKLAYNLCAPTLKADGFQTLKMPSPYEPRDTAHGMMQHVVEVLTHNGFTS